MNSRLLCSPVTVLLFFVNFILITVLLSNKVARNAIADQVLVKDLFSNNSSTSPNPYFDKDFDKAYSPTPAEVVHTRVVYETSTAFTTATATATATHTVTSTHAAVQTLTVSQAKADGLPGFCDECGPEDTMCATYGLPNLERSRAYEGPNTRLRRVLQQAADGQPVKIGVIGGSVTAGHGIEHPDYWTDKFFDWWNVTFPHENNEFTNGAIPATTTDYFAMCSLEHIDEDVDLIIIEMAVNDMRVEFFAKSYEMLVRSLLNFPKKPAVVNGHFMALAFDTISTGGDLHMGVAEYYDIPTISVRNILLWHLFEHPELERGMFTRITWEADAATDFRHMSAVGHQFMADFLIAYMQRQICAQVRANKNPALSQFKPQDQFVPGLEGLGELPRLRMFSKYVRDEREKPAQSSCMSMRGKKHPLAPIRETGWSVWSWKDKSYLIAKEPGARVTFAITSGIIGIVRISYLRSKTFGLGSVKCWIDDDEAAAKRVDGWWDIDGLNLARGDDIANGIPPGPHEVHCEILHETADPGGGHEFRLISLTSS